MLESSLRLVSRVVVAEPDQLITEGRELCVQLPLLLVGFLVLPGCPQNPAGCMFPGVHLALGHRCQCPQSLYLWLVRAAALFRSCAG